MGGLESAPPWPDGAERRLKNPKSQAPNFKQNSIFKSRILLRGMEAACPQAAVFTARWRAVSKTTLFSDL
jgi:hypothetical protein